MKEKVHGEGARVRIATFVFRSIGRSFHRFRLVRFQAVNRKAALRKDAFIIACNHISFLDPIFLWCVLKRPAVALAMAELWAMKIIRSVMKILQHIPVYRGVTGKGDQVVQDSARVLKRGGIILIYPQGRCVRQSEDEANVRYKEGVYLIAKQSGAPVLPAHISGTNVMLPLKKDWKSGVKKFRLRARVRLAFGSEALHVGDMSKEDFLRTLRQRIDSLASAS
jgi:1-acyl-sn-glycerol-3-phosphate acyltransferase